jgi:DNA-binding beta-propeller fold protein YncE
MHKLLTVSLFAALLAVPSTGQRLLAVGLDSIVYRIDPVTGSKTAGPGLSGFSGAPSGLARDPANGTIYLASSSAGLYTLDPATGVATLVGPYGDPAINMHGLEFDSGNNQLFGASQHNGGLYAIDRTTGAATLRGVSGLGGFTNLGYDSRTDTLFATNNSQDRLYIVDRNNGALSDIGPLVASVGPQALAFDEATGAMYLLDSITDQLHAVDLERGTAYPIGSTGPVNLLGLVYVPGSSGGITRQDHGCGPSSILAHGATRPGGTVTVHVGGASGVPFVGFGVVPNAIPFCGCTIGHEWALAIGGATTNLNIPPAAGLLGFQVAIQGLDLFGSGGCGGPQLALTDTLLLTIG